jgi:hypothetical protein
VPCKPSISSNLTAHFLFCPQGDWMIIKLPNVSKSSQTSLQAKISISKLNLKVQNNFSKLLLKPKNKYNKPWFEDAYLSENLINLLELKVVQTKSFF